MSVTTEKASEMIRRVIAAPTDNFVELVKLSGLRPGLDFRECLIRKVDFSGSDLTGFDFTGSHFECCSFLDAYVSDAIFFGAAFCKTDFTEALDWKTLPSDWNPFMPRSARATVGNKAALTGKVVAINAEFVSLDLGGGRAGRVPLHEFRAGLRDLTPKIGDHVPVGVVMRQGRTALSFEHARNAAAWKELEVLFARGAIVEGTIFEQIKGGYSVDILGLIALLPDGQERPGDSMRFGRSLLFRLLKVDRKRRVVIVSRQRAESAHAPARSLLPSSIRVGELVRGVVIDLREFSAVVDLGAVDGLLLVHDITHCRIGHPDEVLSVGQAVTVKVMRIDRESDQVVVSMKDLEGDPWQNVAIDYPIGSKVMGPVIALSDCGAIIEVKPGVEGIVYPSDLSWTDMHARASDFVETGQVVEAVVLLVDEVGRHLSLGLKQVAPNPFLDFARRNRVGSTVLGTVGDASELGLAVTLEAGIAGFVPMSDIPARGRGITAFEKGSRVRATILDIDVAQERVLLGLKGVEPRAFLGDILGPALDAEHDRAAGKTRL